jgi:hypothetical protein
VQVIEVDEDPEQLHAALVAARDRGVRVAVGPLPRGAVNALVEGGRVILPMVTLNFPDRDAAAPATMISFGLSVEAEAQRAVKVALAEFVGVRQGALAGSRFIVLTGAGSLQRRVGQAYVSALRAAGEPPTAVDVTLDTLDRLALQLESGHFEAAFLALDALKPLWCARACTRLQSRRPHRIGNRRARRRGAAHDLEVSLRGHTLLLAIIRGHGLPTASATTTRRPRTPVRARHRARLAQADERQPEIVA